MSIATTWVPNFRREREVHGGSCQALGAIGYRQAGEYLDGLVTHEEMIRLIKRDTRRFAKRQYTWWRNQPRRLGWRELPQQELFSEGNSDRFTETIGRVIDEYEGGDESGIAFIRVC